MSMFKKKQNDQPEWDQDLEPLMKLLIGKKGIKTKSASEIGKKKVDYFRGRDFKKFLLEHGPLLKKKCKAALESCLSHGDAPENDKDVERLGDALIQKQFCYKAMYKPINEPRQDQGSDKKPVKKWPDRLAQTPNQRFDSDGYYVIVWEGENSLRHLLLALLIAGVLLACMFPVWPMWAKVGIWYVTVIFLSLYFGILIWRMVFFAVFWIVGFDFWVFPNLNDEYCGFLDSFKPFYSWEKRADDSFMLLVRFGSLAIVAVAVQQIAETTSMADVEDLVTSSYKDLLDWGVDKLAGALPGSEKAALPSLEEVMKEHADENETSSMPASAEINNDDGEFVSLD